MATAKRSKPAAANAEDTVDALFRAWKKLEQCRTDLISSKQQFRPDQWTELQLDIDVVRDAYYIALGKAVATRDSNVVVLIKQIDQAKATLNTQMKNRGQLVDILVAVDKVASLAGKLLAIGTA